MSTTPTDYPDFVQQSICCFELQSRFQFAESPSNTGVPNARYYQPDKKGMRTVKVGNLPMGVNRRADGWNIEGSKHQESMSM